MGKIHKSVAHGASSKTVAAKYDDLRTQRGKALKETIDALTEHYGGAEMISAPMSIIIDAAVRPKIIILLQIANWVNKQTEDRIVDSEGRVPDVLSRVYIAYTNALRRDLESLSNMSKEQGQRIKPPSISDLIEGK
jgi:hypothetical protein